MNCRISKSWVLETSQYRIPIVTTRLMVFNSTLVMVLVVSSQFFRINACSLYSFLRRSDPLQKDRKWPRRRYLNCGTCGASRGCRSPVEARPRTSLASWCWSGGLRAQEVQNSCARVWKFFPFTMIIPLPIQPPTLGRWQPSHPHSEGRHQLSHINFSRRRAAKVHKYAGRVSTTVYRVTVTS